MMVEKFIITNPNVHCCFYFMNILSSNIVPFCDMRTDCYFCYTVNNLVGQFQNMMNESYLNNQIVKQEKVYNGL